MSHVSKFLIFLISLMMSSSIFSADGHKKLKWDTQNVSVCWADDSDLKKIFEPFFKTNSKNTFNIPEVESSIKEGIQNLVNLHYSKKITGIHFTGWESCLPMDRSVKIFYFKELGQGFKDIDAKVGGLLSKLTDSYLGLASIGRSALFSIGIDAPGKLGSQAVLLRTSEPGTVLHEFGHLSGLRHEHTKIDVYHGDVCQQYKSILNEDFSYRSEKKQGAQTMTIGDDFSIMSYCFIKLWKGMNSINSFDLTEIIDLPYSEYIKKEKDKFIYRILLSQADIHSLRCLYTEDNEDHYCEYHNVDHDKFSKKIYASYLKRITSSESQSIYEY